MTDTEKQRIKAICNVAGVDDIGELSDGFHTFNSLYEQRAILFAALVKAYKDKAWKSHKHEDGELCLGGGWFIVGIDTPEGSYTYHYEDKYWDMFDCQDLPVSKHWDGHTEADAETRLMSLVPEQRWMPPAQTPQWIPCSERLPGNSGRYLVTFEHDGEMVVDWNFYCISERYTGWMWAHYIVAAWMPMPMPEPYKGEKGDR